MTRDQFYSRLWSTSGLQSSRSTHLVEMWLEFYSGAIDYHFSLCFQSKADAEQFIDYNLERIFGEIPRSHYAEGVYEILFTRDVPQDFFPDELKNSLRKLCYRIVNVPICKY